jgi:hypothetical protein
MGWWLGLIFSLTYYYKACCADNWLAGNVDVGGIIWFDGGVGGILLPV